MQNMHKFTRKELQEGMSLYNKLYRLYPEIETASDIQDDFYIAQKISIILVVRWLNKYGIDIVVSMPEYTRQQLEEEYISDSMWDCDEMMSHFQNVILKMTSWKSYFYEVGNVFYEIKHIVEHSNPMPVDDEQKLLEIEVTFLQCFDEGPLKKHEKVFHDVLREIIGIMDGEMADVYDFAVYTNERIVNFNRKFHALECKDAEDDLLVRELLKIAYYDYIPFYALNFCGMPHGLMGEEIVYANLHYTPCYTADEVRFFTILPHELFRMFLLDRVMDYMEEKYPQLGMLEKGREAV